MLDILLTFADIGFGLTALLLLHGLQAKSKDHDSRLDKLVEVSVVHEHRLNDHDSRLKRLTPPGI